MEMTWRQCSRRRRKLWTWRAMAKGRFLIEAKTFRRMGHAQHDPAEYVPAEMKKYWEERDPIARHEKFLFKEKLLDEKGKREIEAKINTLLEMERDFAENSPFPPAEF